MKHVIRVAVILMMVSIVGCGQGDKPDKAADTRPFNAPLKVLEQSKQVEQMTQDAVELQRQKIEQETQ
jgi:hypothetical protein